MRDCSWAADTWSHKSFWRIIVTIYGLMSESNADRCSNTRDLRSTRTFGSQLAKRASVALKTINRFEAVDGSSKPNFTLVTIKTALEAAGIEFIGSPSDRPGIRVGGSPIRGRWNSSVSIWFETSRVGDVIPRPIGR